MPELRPYQIEDVKFLQQYPCMACFNEQRTGKTPTALVAMKTKGCKKVLIVCPKSAMYQWKEEFETWFNKPCIVVNENKNKRALQLSQWTDGLVISYGLFKTTKISDGLIDDILKLKPEGMILDEAHRIKNYKSANAKAMFRCRRIPNRLALTGTPAPNKTHDVWSILHFLDPLTYSSFYKFTDYFFEIVEMGYRDIRGFKPGMAHILQARLDKIATQRKRKDVMPWLPDKDYQKIYLEPTPQQTKYLTELMLWYSTEHIMTQGVLDRLIRYRQICLDPAILDLKGGSPKTAWILDFIEDNATTPVIIFSKFTTYLEKLAQALDKAKISKGVIVGDTKAVDRNTMKLDFQNGKLNVLLIQIDAGKEALTLDRAEAIIFTDKYPPIGDIQQAEDRFIATTEDKKDKAHVIYELILRGTYEEDIYQMLSNSASEVDVINNFKNQLRERRKNTDV